MVELKIDCRLVPSLCRGPPPPTTTTTTMRIFVVIVDGGVVFPSALAVRAHIMALGPRACAYLPNKNLC